MYIPKTFLDLKYQRNCLAPLGKYRVVWMDTLTYEFGLTGDFDTLDQARKKAEEVSGGHLFEPDDSSQTLNKAYIFNDRGEVVGEAGCF